MKAFKIFLFILILCPYFVHAQDTGMGSAAKEANNPLASMKSVSVHNIYSPKLFDLDGSINTTWIRYAQPIKRMLIRVSLPINTVNIGTINRSGLGDIVAFGAYVLTSSTSPNQIGIGPLISVPSATSSVLGAGKWQAGLAFVGYFSSSPIFQYGMLATWQHSFAGKKDRPGVHAASFQPFLLWQLGKGFYLRSSGTFIFDFEKENYLIPIGLGVGKIVVINKKVVSNLFFEPQFAVWNKGVGLPNTQYFIGINTQF